MPVLLEVWTKDADHQCSLTEFYNASDVLGKESFQTKNQSLETVLNFFKERGILEVDDKIISLQDAIDSVKKYSEFHCANELTFILSEQTWLLETGLQTKTITETCLCYTMNKILLLTTFLLTYLTSMKSLPQIKFRCSKNITSIMLSSVG